MFHLRRIFLVVTSLITIDANAYELQTHGHLTFHAYYLSNLANVKILDGLGLSDDADPFGNYYLEVIASDTYLRKRVKFEEENNRMPQDSEALSIAGWLMRGAIREDDYPGSVCKTSPNANLDDNDINQTSRSLNHFFDPVDNAGLRVGPLGTNVTVAGLDAPSWAHGSSNVFTSPDSENSSRENHFSWYDAIEAMYRALTGRRSADGSTDIGPINPDPPMTDEGVRKAYWASMFRSLGDVIHMAEDMAQPQHTRDDEHSGLCGPIAAELITGHKSVYEEYMKARTIQAEVYDIDKGAIIPAPLNYFDAFPETSVLEDYPVPHFDTFSQYFSSAPGSVAGVLNGAGLADYSNRNFFSSGTKLGSFKYDNPSNNLADYVQENPWVDEDGYIDTPLNATVTDKNNESYNVNKVRLITQSVWKKALDEEEVFESPYAYKLKREDYDAMADLLIPRAVAYSAGLIDYFFRGRLKVESVTDEDATHLRVVVENASKWPDENSGISFLTGGTFSFYYTTTDGSRVRLPITQAAFSGGTDPAVISGVADLQVDMPVQITEPGDSTIEFVIDKPGADVSTTEYSPLVVVYKGIVGQEEGIAASVFSSGGLMTFMRADSSIDSFIPFLSEDFGDHWKSGAVVPDAEELISKYAIYYLTYLGEQSLLGSGINESGQPVVYRSEDLGRTWAITPDTAPMVTPDNIYLIKHNKKVFTGGTELVKLNVSPGATYANGHYSDYTVYHSPDSGLTWTAGSAITGVSHPRDLVYLGRTGNTLAIPTPEGDTKEKAFAFIGEYESAASGSGEVGIFRSDDGGVTWQRANTVEFVNTETYLDPVAAIKVNYNMVYLGADRLLINYVSQLENGSFENKFYLSSDRGATWAFADVVPEPDDLVAYDTVGPTVPKVMSLVYLGNDKVYGHVAIELAFDGTHALFLNHPNYESYLLTVSGGSSLIVDSSITELNYSMALTPVVGNTTNMYEKDIYYPFVFAGDNGAIPGLYD